MKTSSLVLVVIAGLATDAAAQPRQEISGRVTLVDTPRKAKPVRPRADWIELASPTPARHGTEFVMVDREAGALAKLRLDLAKGKVIVTKVQVFFDGGKKVITRRNVLDNRHRSFFVDLGGPKLIKQVVVTTERRTDGEYAIYGTSGAADVAAR